MAIGLLERPLRPPAEPRRRPLPLCSDECRSRRRLASRIMLRVGAWGACSKQGCSPRQLKAGADDIFAPGEFPALSSITRGDARSCAPPAPYASASGRRGLSQNVMAGRVGFGAGHHQPLHSLRNGSRTAGYILSGVQRRGSGAWSLASRRSSSSVAGCVPSVAFSASDSADMRRWSARS